VLLDNVFVRVIIVTGSRYVIRRMMMNTEIENLLTSLKMETEKEVIRELDDYLIAHPENFWDKLSNVLGKDSASMVLIGIIMEAIKDGALHAVMSPEDIESDESDIPTNCEREVDGWSILLGNRIALEVCDKEFTASQLCTAEEVRKVLRS